MKPRHGLVTLLLALFSGPLQAADYVIDIAGMHAFIQFRISHLGYSVLVGRFNEFEGTFQWDRDNPGSATVQVVVATESIDTNHAERDKRLRGEECLDVERFAKAIFRGHHYSGDTNGGAMTGTLTLHGVTRPVTLDVRIVGEGVDPWGGYRAGFEATTTLRPSDFGIDYDLGPTAETMSFDLYIEGVRQQRRVIN